ncbi:MAG: hotdog fold thioesterase [Alphaproteobacteria bacterium]|nr:hotdog fold thioesterase [Alphaproteobacteria bacterium]
MARDPVIDSLELKLVDCDAGQVTLALDVAREHLNFNGTCHGGLVFTLADTAFGLAANSHGIVAPGISANIAYHAPAAAGRRLTAVARETARSKRLASYAVEVRRDDGGLVASFTGTVYITTDRHEADS